MTSGDAEEATGEEPASGSTDGSASGAADGPATDHPAAEDGDSTPRSPSTPSTPTGAPPPAADQDRPPTARRKPGVAYRPV